MRPFADVGDLSGLVRDALGTECRIVAVDRLRGGSRKGVYRVRLDGSHAASVIICSWAEAENFWSGAPESDPADPLAPASGLVPFRTAQRSLNSFGARVPRVLLADDSRRRYPADVAVVEDVSGGTLEALFETDPTRAAGALGELAGMLEAMHRYRARHHGRPDLLERGGSASEISCERRILDRALRALDEAAGRDDRITPADTARATACGNWPVG
ncbi:phosphotransferase [Streptomyces sp. NPDC032161]|uniref:phosphotransferase n=1 Tax=unclassified Streptomyces TaxID=2593676 RepID=UPI00341022D0